MTRGLCWPQYWHGEREKIFTGLENWGGGWRQFCLKKKKILVAYVVQKALQKSKRQFRRLGLELVKLPAVYNNNNMLVDVKLYGKSYIQHANCKYISQRGSDKKQQTVNKGLWCPLASRTRLTHQIKASTLTERKTSVKTTAARQGGSSLLWGRISKLLL